MTNKRVTHGRDVSHGDILLNRLALERRKVVVRRNVFGSEGNLVNGLITRKRIVMNKKHRVIFSCDLSRGLGGADNTFDDVGVIQILDDDAKTRDEVEDAAEFLGNDEVGGGSQVLDPLRKLIGDLIDLQPK